MSKNAEDNVDEGANSLEANPVESLVILEDKLKGNSNSYEHECEADWMELFSPSLKNYGAQRDSTTVEDGILRRVKESGSGMEKRLQPRVLVPR